MQPNTAAPPRQPKRILGVFGSFDEINHPELRIGRRVATYGFVSALLEYHSFDEVHFFLPYFKSLPRFEQYYEPGLSLERNQGKIRFFPALSLQAALERHAYTALHYPEHHRFVPELCHQRNRWAREACPVTCVPHSLNPWESHTRNLFKVLPGIMPYDSILCTSRAARSYLENSFASLAESLARLGARNTAYGGRFDMVPLGVRAEELGGRDKARALKNLGLEPGPLTLLCVGRMTPSDKYDLLPLLGALRICVDRADLRLVVAGGAQEGYAQNLMDTAAQMGLAQRLHIFEDFNADLKPDLFGAADIYISPVDNLQETFGISIIEAMAAGLPVLASDFSGYRDLVLHGKTGFLIPSLAPSDYRILDEAWPILQNQVAALQVAQRTALDLNQLAGALLELAGSEPLRREMGQAGRERVLKRYDWPVVIELMEKTWLKLKGMALEHGLPQEAFDPLAAGHARLFGSFPTRSIQDGDLIRLGPLYQPFAQGAWAAQGYEDLGNLLPREGLKAIAALLGQGGGVLQLGALKGELKAQMPEYAVEHLVLHGLKYGLFSLAR